MLFTRELPGGGFVAIESVPGADGVHRARISVERRRDPERRLGHTPPVIASAEGASSEAIFEELYRIAIDNVEVSRGIIRWQAGRRRSGGAS